MFGNYRELYRYRALIQGLTARYLSQRYRGSALGFLWSFLNPLCLMLVYTLVFKYYIRFAQVDNYTIFLFCGLLPWIWFSSGMIEGVVSLVSSGHLITKSMFPPHVLPTVTIMTGMFNFIFSLPMLAIFMLVLGQPFHLSLLALPVLILLQAVFMHGLVLGLSSINVIYRDTQHIVGNLLTFVFFLCPIIYPISSVPERFRFTFALNPLALMTGFYQGIIIDGRLPAPFELLYFAIWTLLALLAGNMLYNRHRESFAELL